jgi:DNA polymerase sliding clamp subunit (PCNA homolog)
VVIKKALGRIKPDVRVIAGPDGLTVQAKGHQHAVEYHDSQPRESAELTMPFAVLEDVQGTKDEPVRLYCPKKKVLAATWEDRRVERTMQYSLPKNDGTDFHKPPASYAPNPPMLLRALHDASQCTDPYSSRYALGCIQLRGTSGRLAATDGKQLLLHSGFTFDVSEDVLVHGTEVFGCSELPQDVAVDIGKTETHVVVKIGPWSFFLALGDGRFPRVEDIIPSFQSAKTTVDLHPDDARFFAENVRRLPGGLEDQAVTFECNGTIAVRSKTEDTQAAEIVLTNSTKTGEDVTICLHRRNLMSLAEMCFDRIYLFGNQNAVLARDDYRSYLFMPLESQQAIKPSEDCLLIPSPFNPRPSGTFPRPYNPTIPMNTNPNAPAATPPIEETANNQEALPPIRRRRRTNKSSGVLEQAIAVRDQLRGTLAGIKDLIRSLKAERRSQKSLKLALDSLKQLQSAA